MNALLECWEILWNLSSIITQKISKKPRTDWVSIILKLTKEEEMYVIFFCVVSISQREEIPETINTFRAFGRFKIRTQWAWTFSTSSYFLLFSLSLYFYYFPNSTVHSSMWILAPMRWWRSSSSTWQAFRRVSFAYGFKTSAASTTRRRTRWSCNSRRRRWAWVCDEKWLFCLLYFREKINSQFSNRNWKKSFMVECRVRSWSQRVPWRMWTITMSCTTRRETSLTKSHGIIRYQSFSKLQNSWNKSTPPQPPLLLSAVCLIIYIGWYLFTQFLYIKSKGNYFNVEIKKRWK